MPLENGSSTTRPYGLFIHKKQANNALNIWAQEHNFCPDALNILPVSHAQGALCPVQAVGKCHGTCHKGDGIEEQNTRIHAMASKLPVADWGKVHEVEITETDELSGRSVIMRCAGGAFGAAERTLVFRQPAALYTEDQIQTRQTKYPRYRLSN